MSRQPAVSCADTDLLRFSFATGSILLVFVGTIQLTSAVLFSLGQPLSWIPFGAACAGAVSYGGWISGRSCRNRTEQAGFFALLLLAAVSVWCACVFVSRPVYDLSFDGQAYHQEAIIQLKEGWNPYTETVWIPDPSLRLWVNHYPKAAWINAAALYVVTNRLEDSKAFNALLMVVSFCLSVAALGSLTGLSRYQALLLALLAALNPVSICQVLSFYVDGQMASLLIIFAALSYLWLVGADRIALLLLAMTLVMLINVKFTGLVYGVVLGVGVAICAAKVMTRPLVATTLRAIATAVLAGVLFVGYNPYVTNTINNGHIFYPLNGEIGTRVAIANRPASFQPLNRFGALFRSLFSESRHAPEWSRLKIPFTITTGEVAPFHMPDVRVGGFGPLFGGAMISSAAILAAASRRRPRTVYAAGGTILGILLSACLNSEAWWARYVPQIWLIPIVALVAGFSAAGNRWLSYASYGVVAALFVNILVIATPYVVYQTRTSRALHQQLAELAARRSPVPISFEYFLSNRVRLREAGVDYKEVGRARCVDSVNLVSSTTRICLAMSDDRPR
jgi:hypothetical protein